METQAGTTTPSSCCVFYFSWEDTKSRTDGSRSNSVSVEVVPEGPPASADVCAQKEMVPGFQSEFREDYQRAGFVAQLLERLPSMNEVLGSVFNASNPST